MEWGAVVSKSFKVLLGVALAITLLPELTGNAWIANPADAQIVRGVRPFFDQQGFQVAGETRFAGREALLVGKDNCMIYAVPVAHQGWHQATVRQSTGTDQSLWFAFEGRVTKDRQSALRPLLTYYTLKSLRYLGLPTGYPPVLALVIDGGCTPWETDWSLVPTVPFVAKTPWSSSR